MTAADFPALLQAFFTDRLLRQRQASPHTVTAYRATFRLLLRFAVARLRRPPSDLAIADLDAALLGDFLDHLERDRGNSARSRNARLAALHAFFRYVAITEPCHALHCQRVLAISSKRFERGLVEFLCDEEIAALLDGPDPATGSAAAIAPSSSSRSRPAFASPSSPGFAGRTSSSAPAPISAATARGASSGARRCAATS